MYENTTSRIIISIISIRQINFYTIFFIDFRNIFYTYNLCNRSLHLEPATFKQLNLLNITLEPS